MSATTWPIAIAFAQAVLVAAAHNDGDRAETIHRWKYERIRAFLVRHCTLNDRDDSEFWSHWRNLDSPASPQAKIELFLSHGRIVREGENCSPR